MPAGGVRPARRRRLGRVLLGTLVLVLVAVAAAGAVALLGGPDAPRTPPASPEPRSGEDVRYVSPSGSDDAQGTEDAPWKTIDHALSEDRPGVRVLVRAGTYEDQIDRGPSGEEGRPMVVEAYPGERPVVNAQLELNGSSHLRVSGLVFDGEDTSGTAIRITGGEDVELSRNEVRNYRGGDASQGFLLTDGALRTRIVANRIHDLGTWSEHDHGIYCRSSDAAYFANNVIYGLDQGVGIHLYDDDGEGCDDATIVANTIWASQTSGIVLSRGADRNLVTGNVIAGHDSSDTPSYGYAVREGDGVGEDNVVRGNLGWDNAQEPDFACEGCEDNDEGDPRFRDPEAGDFRLGEGSAARGGLPAEDAPRRDFTGQARPRDGEADRGAYQAASG